MSDADKNCTVLDRFSPSVKIAFSAMFPKGEHFLLNIKRMQGDAVLTDICYSYVLTVSLKNAGGVFSENKDMLVTDYTLSKIEANNKYTLLLHYVEPDDYLDEKTLSAAIHFTDMEAELIPTDPFKSFVYSGNAIMSVCTATYSIAARGAVSTDYINEDEKREKHLIAELCTLGIAHYFDPDSKVKFTELYDIAKRHGFGNLKKSIKTLEKAANRSRRSYLANQTAFMGIINDSKYEPFVREIRDRIANPQKDYPSTAEILANEEERSSIRERITDILKKRGFVGTYPYFICEKDGRLSIVNCKEVYSGERLSVLFESGYTPAKNPKADILSCQFNGKDRNFHLFLYKPEADRIEIMEGKVFSDLEKCSDLAARAALVSELTKEEQMMIRGLFPKEAIKSSVISNTVTWFFGAILFSLFSYVLDPILSGTENPPLWTCLIGGAVFWLLSAGLSMALEIIPILRNYYKR